MAIAPKGWKPRADAGEESVKDLDFVKRVKPSPENDCSSVGYRAYCDLFAGGSLHSEVIDAQCVSCVW